MFTTFQQPFARQEERGAWWSALERWALFILILAAPLFFLPTTSDPVGLNKQLFVGVIIIGVFVAVLARLIDKGSISLPPRGALIASGALLGSVALSAIFSEARAQSFIGTAPDSLLWVAMYVVAFIVASTTLTTRASLRMAATLFLLSSGLLTVFALLQGSGTFIFPQPFAQAVTFTPMGSMTSLGFVAAAAFAALIAFVSSPLRPVLGMLQKGALAVLALLFFLLIAQLNDSGIWLSLAVSMGAVAALVGYQALRQNRGSMRPLLLPFLVMVISLFAFVVGPNINGFMQLGIDVRPSTSSSWQIARQTLAGPDALWGNGPATYPYAYGEHRPATINQTDFWGVQFNQGYSAFLTYLTTWGVLGAFALLAVLALFGLTVARGLSAPSQEQGGTHALALGALAVMVVLGTSMFVYQGNTVSHLVFFLAAGIAMSALVLAGSVKGTQVVAAGSPKVLLASSLAAIVLMSVALGGLYFMVERYRAQVLLASAVESYQLNQDLQTTILKLNDALAVDSDSDIVLRTASQAMILRLSEVVQDEELDAETARSQFTAALQNAVQTAQRATEVAPWNVQNWLQLASVYEQVIGFVEGAEQLAADYYDEVQQRDPNNPSVPLAQARVYMSGANLIDARLAQQPAQGQQGLTQEQRQELQQRRDEYLSVARDYLNESISLKENYSEARFLLAQVLQQQGDTQSALAESRRVVQQNPQNVGALLQLGILDINGENYEEAIVVLERAKLLVEDYANARYFLGIAYARTGQSEAAEAEFEWLVDTNPDNELVRQVLTNVREGRDPLAAPAEQPQDGSPVPDTGGAQGGPLGQ